MINNVFLEFMAVIGIVVCFCLFIYYIYWHIKVSLNVREVDKFTDYLDEQIEKLYKKNKLKMEDYDEWKK